MTPSLLHTFRYGKRTEDRRQRWGFRFGLPSLVKPTHRGRPASSVKAACFSVSGSFFWSSHEAALECDFWKLVLARNYGIDHEFSFGTYDNFALAFMAKHSVDVEARVSDFSSFSHELQEFLSEHEDVLFELSNCSESGSWNADVELYRARKQIHDIQGGASGDLKKACELKEWATQFKDHQELLRDVKDYGLGRLEYEVNIQVVCLQKLLAAGPIAAERRIEGRHRKLAPLLDAVNENLKVLRETLQKCLTDSNTFQQFKAMLAARTEELKKSKP